MTACKIAPLLLLLAACQASSREPQASYDSPLFTRPPEVLYRDHQYVCVIYPQPDWTVVVAEVALENKDNATILYASKLKKGPASSPQYFPLNIPGTVDPALVGQALLWRNPNGWVQALTLKTAP